MNVGIDIDGVLFPWTDVANEALIERFGIPDPGPHTTWEHLKNTLPGECWKWLWGAEGQQRIFGQVDRVYAGSVEVVNRILEQGHRVHFVTHRDPRRTAIDTTRFLGLHFGQHPWAGVHVVQNSVAKHALMAWDVFIDDKPETVMDMLLHTGPGSSVFSPVRPWNTELTGISDPRFIHYSSPEDILKSLGGSE